MKAVNLIPAEERRGAGGLAGRSGGIVYVVVGGLALVVALGVVYASSVKTVADRKGQLASVTAQVGGVQAQTSALAPYVAVGQLSTQAVSGVVSVAETRFNWPEAMRQIALALPDDVTLTSFGASASAQAGASTTTSTGAGSTVSLSGCATSQAEVATVLTRLAEVPSVTDVVLSTATKVGPKAPNVGPQLGPDGGITKGGSGCALVSFALSFDYAANYTVPNEKLPAQTVSKVAAAAHASLTSATSKPAG